MTGSTFLDSIELKLAVQSWLCLKLVIPPFGQTCTQYNAISDFLASILLLTFPWEERIFEQ
jgi:hypothetical protein